MRICPPRELPVEDLTAHKIETWMARMYDEKNLTAGSVNRRKSYLSTILNKGVVWGYLDENPARRVAKLKEDPRIPDPLTDEDVDQLLAVLPEYARVVVVVALHTGMRAGELFAMDWQDVDFRRGEINAARRRSGRPRLGGLGDHSRRARLSVGAATTEG